jgi:hypothetical protein
MHIDDGVDFDDRAADDDVPDFILVIVVGTPLVNVCAAAVLLGLARRQSAVAPARLSSFTPARRTAVAVIDVVLVSIAALPALISIPTPVIIVVEVLVAVLVPVVLVVIRSQGWRDPSECGLENFMRVRSRILQCRRAGCWRSGADLRGSSGCVALWMTDVIRRIVLGRGRSLRE